MGRAPDFAHATFPEPRDQAIAAELLGARGFLAEGIHHALTGVRQRHDQDVGKHDGEEEPRRRELKRRSAAEHHPANDKRHGRNGRDRRDEGLHRSRGHDHRKERRPDRDPRQPHPPALAGEMRQMRVLGDGDAEVAEHEEDETEVHQRGQRQVRVDRERGDDKRHRDCQNPGQPIDRRRQQHRAGIRKDEVRHVPGHEKRERVHQGEDAEPSSRAAEDLCRESRRALVSRGGGRVTRPQELFARGVRRHAEPDRRKSTPAFTPCTLSIRESGANGPSVSPFAAFERWRRSCPRPGRSSPNQMEIGMRKLYMRRAAAGALAIAVVSIGAFAVAQGVTGGFEGFWGSKYSSGATESATLRTEDGEGGDAGAAALSARTGGGALALARTERRSRPVATDARSRLLRWNQIAIDASGVDHTPVQPGESRVFGEALGPGRASRAIAIVHIAMFDAMTAIQGGYKSYTGIQRVGTPVLVSTRAAIAQAAHDTLIAMFPSQKATFARELQASMNQLPANAARITGRMVGASAAKLILQARKYDGSQHAEPTMGAGFTPSNE